MGRLFGNSISVINSALTFLLIPPQACRYEKGHWSECIGGKMTREDKLKPAEDGSPQSCNPVRSVDHKCNPGGVQRSNKERKHKDKGKKKDLTSLDSCSTDCCFFSLDRHTPHSAANLKMIGQLIQSIAALRCK